MQEKAYDKISHDYLWKVLEKFELPDQFIKTVQSIYRTAETVIIINGEISSLYKVTRGVRQGDPLSCILFNIAIEPLAAMLRKSDLRGIKISGLTEKLITILFADDTTVYLAETDKFSDLQDILQQWCKASGAKYNITKTEVILLGSQKY